MKLTFIGATHEVTGSCTLLEACGKKILIDCGMEQGADIFENIQIPVAPNEIDAVCVTHAHIDHTGKLPFLVAQGYSGPIYSTGATKELCDIMLMDSAHIQEFEAEWRNRKAKRAGKEEYVPLYTSEDAQNTLKLFDTAGYQHPVKIADGITISFTDAGHLLGSSDILFTIEEEGITRTLLFSGDIGNINKPLINNPMDPPHADYVVCESTYGDRLHPERPDYVKELTAVIQETLDRGGNVVIPSFAVGRTQELLYFIRIIKEQDLIKNHADFPVVVDSPMAVRATNIYNRDDFEYYDEEAVDLVKKGINPIVFPGLKVSTTSDESKAINDDATPKVIISASGMCEAGRIRHHLKHNLWRSECTILFVGYQSAGTIGAKLLDGAEDVKLFGEDITVSAEIRRIDAFSSHGDRDMLLDWLAKAAPSERIFINHGEDAVTESFAKEAQTRTGTASVAPYSGEVWDLATNELVHKAVVVPVIKKEAQGGKVINAADDGKKSAGAGSKNAGNNGAGSGSKNAGRSGSDSGSGSKNGAETGRKYYKATDATARAENVYNELMKAGFRLNGLIQNSQGGANKDIEALTRAINEICDKYER